MGLIIYVRSYDGDGRWARGNIGDWLIGYQDGFVRRGLIGEVVFELGRHGPKVSPAASVFALQVLLMLLSAIGITVLARAKCDRWLPWMLLSPAGLLFFITNRRFLATIRVGGGHFYYLWVNGGMRKEILLFVVVLGLGLAIGRSPRVMRTLVALSLLAYGVEMLSWEAAAFFLPLLIVLLNAALRPESRNVQRAGIAALVLMSAGGLLLSYLAPGSARQASVICTSYRHWGAPTKQLCSGAIFALTKNLSYEAHLVWYNFPVYLLYILLFALCLVPFVLSGWVARHWRLLLVVFAASLPLYVIGSDYGRWIHTTIVLLTVHWLTLDERTEPPRDFAPFWVRDLLLIPWFGAWSLPFFSIPIRLGGLFSLLGKHVRRFTGR